MYLKTSDLPVQESLDRLCASDPCTCGSFRYAAAFVCKRLQRTDPDDGGDSGSLQHHAARQCAYPDAGSRVEKQKGKAFRQYRSGMSRSYTMEDADGCDPAGLCRAIMDTMMHNMCRASRSGLRISDICSVLPVLKSGSQKTVSPRRSYFPVISAIQISR